MIIGRLDTALSHTESYGLGRGTTTGYITLRASRVLQGAAEEATASTTSSSPQSICCWLSPMSLAALLPELCKKPR